MLAADTNVWARACLNDEPAQTRKARSALPEARSAGGIFLPLLVLAELSWVLRGRWERERVLNTLQGLLQAKNVTVESPVIAWKALQAARNSPAGFADHLIAEVCLASGAGEVITFDKAFSRKPGCSPSEVSVAYRPLFA